MAGEFIQIVDAALAEAARKSGPWLVCKPGCCDCCMGPFTISDRDAARLRTGLAELVSADPERAARVRERARAAVERLPDLSEDEPCPVLDPDTGTCDLYSARPFTCRVFGPPIQWGGDAVGVCELCFHGATDDQIAACAVELAVPEEELSGEIVIAKALA
jgi:Fe-S-cluster containining protein